MNIDALIILVKTARVAQQTGALSLEDAATVYAAVKEVELVISTNKTQVKTQVHTEDSTSIESSLPLLEKNK